jgi:hypothetical protein
VEGWRDRVLWLGLLFGLAYVMAIAIIGIIAT